MAIYSLHHTAIGKTTQARPHTAAAHVKYIARPQAMRHFEARRCPAKPSAAMRYFRDQEDHDRANARVADKIMLALPRELSPSERVVLVRHFAEGVTNGRAPWLAAFHDKGKDAQNPHCHLVIRDRDPETGRRVICTSEPGSTERFREMWERHANLALEMAGRSERIDRRTLRAQGIERKPTIHEGPRAQEMDARGAAPKSKPREARNGPGAKRDSRKVDYPRIDGGISRPAYNRMIREKETEADYWAALDAHKRDREFEALGHGEEAMRERKRKAPSEHKPAGRGLAGKDTDDKIGGDPRGAVGNRPENVAPKRALNPQLKTPVKQNAKDTDDRVVRLPNAAVRHPPESAAPKPGKNPLNKMPAKQDARANVKKPSFSEWLLSERSKPKTVRDVKGQKAKSGRRPEIEMDRD